MVQVLKNILEVLKQLKMCLCDLKNGDHNIIVQNKLDSIIDLLTPKPRNVVYIRLDADSSIQMSTPFETNSNAGTIGTVGREYVLNYPFYAMEVNFLKGTEEDSIVEINQIAYISGSNCEYEGYRNKLPNIPLLDSHVYNPDGLNNFTFKALDSAVVEIMIIKD